MTNTNTYLRFTAFFISLFLGSSLVFAQQGTGEIRGFVYDKESGEPMIFTNVFLRDVWIGKPTDINGFYALSKLKPGAYTLQCFAIGYDTATYKVEINAGKITTQNIYLVKRTQNLKEVQITAEKQKAQTEVKISNITITQKDLKQLPSFGGEPDLAQYLQILPGVVFTGDQGGQLYIRGGPPVQNKILLDGMIIYNPFHSIGLFSVFDADIIRSADVFAGGFNAQYGGRIGAIVDVTTREGNKKQFSAKVSANTLTSKALIEGPIKKFTEGGGSASYILSYKTSYLDQTSKLFYGYADPDNITNGLPYSFNDLYGKLSYIGDGGSKVNFFGFNFADNVNLPQTKFNWNARGIGTNFFVVPEGSTIINGNIAYSDYDMEQKEADGFPRSSGISGFNVGLNFTNFFGKDEIKYGFEINGFRTKFSYVNAYGLGLSQDESTTELAGFAKYRIVRKRLVVEPGLRIMAYASLGNYSFEPRLGIKYNITDRIRVKAAGGLYSQNLLSAVSDQDVVNLFYGFLSGPDDLPETFDGKNITHKMQTAIHYVGGFEFNVGNHGEINAEAFYKDFTQLTNINRDKQFENTPENAGVPDRLKQDYIIETGSAYGADITYKYEYKRFYFWAVYSLTYVNRFDGIREYFPSFDRRHNINLVGSIAFGKEASWSLNTRWNYGSGFPFTQTQGSYESLNFNNGITTNILNQNGQLNNYFRDFNTGRLPSFHRLDVSLSKKIKFKNKQQLTLIASVTNVYNRQNIFYFDRSNFRRVDQLPIMPTLGINFSF
ncbi:MAG: TonB-dependent receptor [Bacteroidia bacterium]|jgi:hypothetical protein|nr:TonB-dependent receptor [Bacteroidia bacterium]